MVMSTLHTNSAPETLTRLRNMGVPAFNLATSVSLVIAQRLGRRLCKECKTLADDIPREILLEEGFTEEMLETATIMKAVGCPACSDGYKGRVGIYEVVRITPEITDLVITDGHSLEISRKAREQGFADLRTSALRKCADGLISLEEANRVTFD